MTDLIKCKDCNKQISKRATSCPNCGCPTKKRTDADLIVSTISKSSTLVASFVLFIVIAVFIGSIFSSDTVQDVDIEAKFEIVDYLKLRKDIPTSVIIWKENTLNLGTKNDGTPKASLAVHVCKILKEKGYNTNNITIKIFDVDEWYSNGVFIAIGNNKCK